MNLQELTHKRTLLMNELAKVDDEIIKARQEVYKNMLRRTYVDCLSRASMTHITVDDKVIQI
ncbi:hypothetical protein R50345_06040 [Paenibacillus sp. FSL R5-0345]|uniref:hypothetical protein n=1 Tax=Paenibacillus sp. FSL R5-0345 TaxID=1536770 RepID=UPI0004F89704|nr:hypothetical protein [Paenibacillus sp. FSL R5-0345]AIQ34221.1 hypothetical protein R50345_06040 [Paenibacillus sp. FSL R5-0345]